jgi:hypothetical protein
MRCAFPRHRLPAANAPPEIAAALAAALAPYDRNDCTHGPYDPSATWDRWQPARGATAFPLLPRGLDRLRPGRRRVAFAAPKRAIDFTAVRDGAGAARRRRVQRLAELLPRIGRSRHHPGPGTLSRLNGQDTPRATGRPRA